jgi:hypothetical protein
MSLPTRLALRVIPALRPHLRVAPLALSLRREYISGGFKSIGRMESSDGDARGKVSQAQTQAQPQPQAQAQTQMQMHKEELTPLTKHLRDTIKVCNASLMLVIFRYCATYQDE